MHRQLQDKVHSKNHTNYVVSVNIKTQTYTVDGQNKVNNGQQRCQK